MNNQNMLQTATATVTEAIKLDNEKKYDDAYQKYQRALEQFMVALKYEKNPKSKTVLQQRIEGYMCRAEQLKEAVQEAEKNPPKAAAATVDGGDTETSKLRGALAGAIVMEKPNVKWSDVAGLEGAKEALKEAVILPTKFPQLFTGERRPWTGILLYGPPGTGKSYLAKAVATEADSKFFSVSSSDLVSKWQGESEKLVRNLFEMARESKPSIIFIDEIDSLCGARSDGENDSARRIKTEFLVQMQGVGKNHGGVLVLGATNTPWSLDPAMRRRFEKRIYIPLPESPARKVMFKLNVGRTPNDLQEKDFDRLGKKSEGYSGSDISVVVRDALMQPLRRCQKAKQFIRTADNKLTPCDPDKYPNCSRCPPNVSGGGGEAQCSHCGAIRMNLYDVSPEDLLAPNVQVSDFDKALESVNSSVSPEELTRFEEWTSEFGQDG